MQYICFKTIDETGQQREYDARKGIPYYMNMESDIRNESILNVDL